MSSVPRSRSGRGNGPTASASREALDRAGRAFRARIPRSSHAAWTPGLRRRDPVATLLDATKGLGPSLLPIRFGRMLESPFTFFRGAAAVMAADLARTPSTGVRLQACGDCHLLNFGGFATPERRLVFVTTRRWSRRYGLGGSMPKSGADPPPGAFEVKDDFRYVGQLGYEF